MATMKISKCAECNQQFPSRNQLFKHLNESGHGAPGNAKDDDGDGKKAAADGSSSSNNSTPQLAKGNDAYYEYYLRQKICNSHDEDDNVNEGSWNEAYHKLRTPLPISYRIHESSSISEFSVQLLALVEKSEEEVCVHKNNDSAGDDGDNEKGATKETSERRHVFQQWTFNTAETGSSIPKFRMTVTPRFHHSTGNKSKRSSKSKEVDESDIYSPILHALQELGAIHRQELVSAIPPLVLWAACSKEKGDNSNDGTSIIADLCAAPGSKSLQLLDMMYTSSATDGNNNNIPPGLLVVNDSDRNRIITLCQRSRHVPRAPMLSLNMDARYFPGMRRRCKSKAIDKVEGGVAPANAKQKSGYKQKYDKVLCDVPCSGDGTTRKNKQVWSTWSIGHAMSLHRLQRKILRRAMDLLRPGGTVVYSTCSLNPLEDEAVVSSVISDVGGLDAMEIVPLPHWIVEKCIALKGLNTWQVPIPNFGKKNAMEMYQSFDDVPQEHQSGKEKKKGGQINQSMFPPAKESEISRQLAHCGRFLPSTTLDSGGFFVACIRRLKVGELVVKDQASQSFPNPSSKMVSEEPKSPTAKKDKAEDPKLSAMTTLDTDATPTTKDGQILREGDWICSKCNEVNFGRRGGSRCFVKRCKARNPNAVEKGKEGKIQQPLLRQPNQSIMECFFQLFGIQTGPDTHFPLDNTRVICRAKESVMVVISDGLSKLSISDSWGPVRELGITLAAFPNDESHEETLQSHEFRLYDEGLPILALCATRRHFKLQPVPFRNALAQSVRLLIKSSPAAEAERVKATLDRSLVLVASLCESDMWYDTLNDSMKSMWALCKASPGFFIVSCECKILSEGSTGSFAFCGCVDDEGTVTVTTSLRVTAAMLVVINKYSEVCHSPETKRRRV